MHCIHCGHKQDKGDFCGMCGNGFSESGEHTASSTSTSVPAAEIDSSYQLDQLKEKIASYIRYFIKHLKRPSDSFTDKNADFQNAAASILIFSLINSLSLYKLLIPTTDNTSSIANFGGIFISCLGLLAIAILSISVINHFLGPQLSFKLLISFFGAHLSLPICLAFITYIFIVLNPFSFGNVFLFIILAFTIAILPLYLIHYILIKKSSSIDSFYSSISFLVIFSILLLIFMSFLKESLLFQLLK